MGGIRVGGVIAGTQNCPDGVNWDDPPGGVPPPPPPDDGSDPTPPDPDSGPSLISTTGGSAVVPLDPGFNITNTTGSGNNQKGRLIWREIVR
jgi:hypothetical protein